MAEKHTKNELPRISRRNIKKRRDDIDGKKDQKLRAVAVKYDVKKDRAPKIVASGRGKIAEEILKLAEDNKVPFYEDEALTELLGKLDFDDEIPPELYTIIAEVLAFVYQLEKLAKKGKKTRSRVALLGNKNHG